MSNNWKSINRILLSRTDSIGDVVLSLPLAGYLKTIYPEATIDFLGKTYTQAIIECENHIENFVNYDELQKEDAVAFLKNKNYDAVIHIFPNKEVAKWCKKATIPLRIGTSHRIFHWTTVNKKVNFTRKKSDLHESQLNFKLLEGLNIFYTPDLSDVSNYINFKPNDLKLPIALDVDKKYIILHPGSKGSAEDWPLKNYILLAELLIQKGINVIFTGTKNEADTWKEKLPKNKNIHDLGGQLTLPELITLISRCYGLVACSTGPLHIAGIVNSNAIGIFSSRRPIHPGRWKPLGKLSQTIVYDENCETCKTQKSCDCISKIAPDTIIERLSLN